MDETSRQPLEPLVPQITRQVNLRDNQDAGPTEIEGDPYIVAFGSLANNTGFFTRAGLGLPPSSWEAVVAHIEGIRPGHQISEGGSEAQGVYLLDAPDAPQSLSK